MSKTLTFQFTHEQAQVVAMGLDALLRARGLEVTAAVADVNSALQSQAAAQLNPQKGEDDGSQ